MADLTVIDGGRGEDEPPDIRLRPWACPHCIAAGERPPNILWVAYAGGIVEGRHVRVSSENRRAVLICPGCYAASRSAPGALGERGGVALWDEDEKAWQFVFEGNR